MSVLEAAASLSPVTQVILSVVGLVAGASVMWALRQAVKIVRGAGTALERLDEFTHAATVQMAATAEINAIAAQLGTQSHKADMKSLEDYLHDFRHDFNNWRAIQEGLVATQVKVLERTTDVLDGLTKVLDRLTAIEEQKTA